MPPLRKGVQGLPSVLPGFLRRPAEAEGVYPARGLWPVPNSPGGVSGTRALPHPDPHFPCPLPSLDSFYENPLYSPWKSIITVLISDLHCLQSRCRWVSFQSRTLRRHLARRWRGLCVRPTREDDRRDLLKLYRVLNEVGAPVGLSQRSVTPFVSVLSFRSEWVTQLPTSCVAPGQVRVPVETFGLCEGELWSKRASLGLCEGFCRGRCRPYGYLSVDGIFFSFSIFRVGYTPISPPSRQSELLDREHYK